MVWDFTPQQAWNPVEVAEHLKKGCLAFTKEIQLLALCWGQAYAYRACVCVGKRVSGSEALQTESVAKPETQTSTITVAPIFKKKQWKCKSTWLVRDEEAPPEREQEEESEETACSAAEQPQEQEREETEIIIESETTRSLSLSELRDIWKDYSHHPGQKIITWLLR
ncbi:hypothetical protein QYF61_005553 [Mycteria americana]|uniref:Uncharacterized protein n=1 Tax=Mycteria americana TaxID=33587 RepID=A0AAN7MJ66_MYCAM|nr:hypothetical protein QYF61_005553 [Mycteria americana]